MKKGFGLPILLLTISLLGVFLLASGYLYTAFTLTAGAPPTISELGEKGLSGQEIEDTLRAENEKNLSKYLPPEEIDRIKKQELDQKIKSDIGQLATELQGFYTTPGNGKYPATLAELNQTVSGNYQYIVCLDNTNSILFSQLNAVNGYWVWSSFENQTRVIDTMPTEKNCMDSRF